MFNVIKHTKFVDIQLSDHFKLSEFRCHCGDNPRNRLWGCGGAVIIPPEQLIDRLERLRSQVGLVLITRGYSCIWWNKQIRGKPKSFHTMYNQRFSRYGAADCAFPELKKNMPAPDYLYTAERIAGEIGFTGRIIYEKKGILHLDCRLEEYREINRE